MSQQEALIPPAKLASRRTRGQNSQDVVLSEAAPEFVFAVVGHIGSGTTTVAEKVKAVLVDNGYETHLLKATDEIKIWARTNNHLNDEIPNRKDISYIKQMQDLGDLFRRTKSDNSVVAAALIKSIVSKRRESGAEEDAEGVVLPDHTKRAYVIDSLRHPQEAALLRRVYGPKFILIGVVCEENARLERLQKKITNAGEAEAKRLMESDAQSTEPWGQKVSKTFHLSDLFVDNTPVRYRDPERKVGNPEWKIPDQLSRLIHILTHDKIVRPTVAETGMYIAHGAQIRSACLSRQVGACLVDPEGDVIAIGYNEVPKGGGGVYGAGLTPELTDHRCAYREGEHQQYCSNTREQIRIIKETIDRVPTLAALPDETKKRLQEEMRKSPIGSLLEFSRAVHAEMGALLSAARKGRRTSGASMFVTTFPCHYCARHLITAGIAEIHYIEPYPKSKAFELHGDALVSSPSEQASDNDKRVLVKSFTGVAPKMYARAFLKDRDLKDDVTGDKDFGIPDWGDSWFYSRIGYPHLERKLKELLDG